MQVSKQLKPLGPFALTRRGRRQEVLATFHPDIASWDDEQ
jgi:hypothetical protein